MSPEMNGNGSNEPSSSKPKTEPNEIINTNTATNLSIEPMEQPTSSTEGSFNSLSIPKYGTLIPNRVFVGGISCHTTEMELNVLFSKFGSVKGTKIIIDRSGLSKGYGFVTFETEEEAKRLFNAMNSRELPPIIHRDRRLNIAPAVKKQPNNIRQASSYGSQSSGTASSTFSPPPALAFDPYCNYGGQGELFIPPETFFPTNPIGFPVQANHLQSPGPFFSQIPNLALGQTLPGPNGSILFLPVGLPYQQTLTSSDHFGSSLNGFGTPANFRVLGQPQPNSFHGCNSHSHNGALTSIPSIPSHHHYVPDHILGESSSGADQMLYFNSSMLASPH